jgi:hypothetical protein
VKKQQTKQDTKGPLFSKARMTVPIGSDLVMILFIVRFFSQKH